MEQQRHLAAEAHPSQLYAANADRHALPPTLVADLRSDHAGETGAVMIYRGVLAVSRNKAVQEFAEHHLAIELRHLKQMETLLPPEQRTRLLGIWRIAGWLTGALPALFGANAVYATIEAVETFVDRHYQEQIDRLSEYGRHAQLRNILLACQADEVAHRDEAAAQRSGKLGLPLSLWAWLVGAGSAGAVSIARRL